LVVDVEWSPTAPNILTYYTSTAKGLPVELAVVQRKVEALPEGFGFNELVRITEQNQLERCARVQRRYRMRDDAVIEGLEIVKTYRVLDGIAGTEFPTSTTKSQLQMKRVA